MSDERGTVISDFESNSNRSDDDGNDEREESERVGGGDNAILTLTHSLNPSHIISLISV